MTLDDRPVDTTKQIFHGNMGAWYYLFAVFALTSSAWSWSTQCPSINLCLAIDESSSINLEEFNMQTNFLVKVTLRVAALAPKSSFAAVGFSTTAHTIREPTHRLKSFIFSLYNNRRLGGYTASGSGLLLCKHLFKKTTGRKVVLLISDGSDNREPDGVSTSAWLKAVDIRIATVGVGGRMHADDLGAIATRRDFFTFVSEFSALFKAVDAVVRSICAVSRLSPSPSLSPTSTPSTSPSSSVSSQTQSSSTVPTPSTSPSSSITPIKLTTSTSTPSITSTTTPSETPPSTPLSSVTPTLSPTLTSSISPITSITPTPSITSSKSATLTPSVTTTQSITPTPSNSLTPSLSSTPSGSAMPSSTMTPSISMTPSKSAKPSRSVTSSISMTPSKSATPSGSVTPSISMTPSKSATPSGSVTPSISITPPKSVTPSSSTAPSRSATPSSVPVISTSYTSGQSPTPMESPSVSASLYVHPVSSPSTSHLPLVSTSALFSTTPVASLFTLATPIPSASSNCTIVSCAKIGLTFDCFVNSGSYSVDRKVCSIVKAKSRFCGSQYMREKCAFWNAKCYADVIEKECGNDETCPLAATCAHWMQLCDKHNQKTICKQQCVEKENMRCFPGKGWRTCPVIIGRHFSTGYDGRLSIRSVSGRVSGIAWYKFCIHPTYVVLSCLKSNCNHGVCQCPKSVL